MQGKKIARSEIHASLGSEEVVRCFNQSGVRKASGGSKDEANPIYRELSGMKGSVVVAFELSRAQLRGVSRNVLTNFGRGPRRAAFRCTLRLRVPRGLYIAVDIPENAGVVTRLRDSSGTKDVECDFNATEDYADEAVLFAGSSSAVDAVFIVKDFELRAAGRVVLLFHALETWGLQVAWAAAGKGFIQTPLYRDRTLSLTPRGCLWARVKVPPGHVIMVASPALGEVSRCASLYAEDTNNATLAVFCPLNVVYSPFVAVYNTSSFLLRLFPVRTGRLLKNDAGFRMSFSFHAQSSQPAKVSGRLWNCSALDRELLLHHLACNLELECYGAEDEKDCFYATDLCGPGGLTLAGACYFYVRRPEVSVTWNGAAGACAERGGRLAVLNTPRKWEDAVRVVSLAAQFVGVFVGVKNPPLNVPLYRVTLQWIDSTTAFYVNAQDSFQSFCQRSCGYVSRSCQSKFYIEPHVSCKRSTVLNILCEKPSSSQSTGNPIPLVNETGRWPLGTKYVACPAGHYTQQFLACDVRSSCWSRDRLSRARREGSSLAPLPPSLACADRQGDVPYTLACDGRWDCGDGSDEKFCKLAACVAGEFSCDNEQCIASAKVCDGRGDCQNAEDEADCFEMFVGGAVPPPALVKVDSRGHLVTRPLNASRSVPPESPCPNTHFQCPDNGYCLPLFLRCNQVNDCPGREDETGCDACPGFYRCRASAVCLLRGDLCDGHAHCPQHDDELLCNLTCPPACVCRGLAFFCERGFATSRYPFLRYLDASGTGMTPSGLTGNSLLIHLVLADCGLRSLDGLDLPNLLSLEIQGNQLRTVSRVNLVGAPQLRELSVSGNPLALAFEDREEPPVFGQVLKLDLSRVVMHVLNVTALSAFPNLRVLNLSRSGVQRVQEKGLGALKQLHVLDLRGCPMTWFPRGMFRGLSSLQVVYAHTFKVCCSAVLPAEFNLRNCFAPSDEISSCSDLLRGAVYKACASVLSVLALVGNSVSFVFRTCVSKRENKLGYASFVTHLSVSDFIMGLYLAVIVVADQVYHGVYLWNDVAWKRSVTCRAAGFLSLLSCEVSALILCLITVDRFLVLRFPFSRLHFSPRSAHLSSAVVWIGGLLLVSVPLLPATSHWEIYSQTGVCVPLPITRRYFAGYVFSFSVLIVFNFLLFVVISLGQLSIYWSVRANSLSVSNTTKKTNDLTIARRLITVAMTDFLCWFPIGVLGLLASSGLPVPSEVNVAVVIFVLPVNSAVNPCLYTVNVILERRRRQRDERLRAALFAQLKTRS